MSAGDRPAPGYAEASPRVVVLGASNMIARYLARRLSGVGRDPLAVARRSLEGAGFGQTVRLDVLDAGGWRVPAGADVVSILPLAVLARSLRLLEGAGSIVAIGSTSQLSKAASVLPAERAMAASLAEAEFALGAWCGARAIPHTILRPTLVYDGFGDRNIARMARLVRRFGVLPIAAPAKGLRQPIHADDVARAIVAALGNLRARDRSFNIAGGEILTYRAMAERVFRASGREPRFLPLPIGALETAFGLGLRLGLLRGGGTGPSVFRRMNEDLVYETAPGLDTLDYRPRAFVLPDLRRGPARPGDPPGPSQTASA